MKAFLHFMVFCSSFIIVIIFSLQLFFFFFGSKAGLRQPKGLNEYHYSRNWREKDTCHWWMTVCCDVSTVTNCLVIPYIYSWWRKRNSWDYNETFAVSMGAHFISLIHIWIYKIFTVSISLTLTYTTKTTHFKIMLNRHQSMAETRLLMREYHCFEVNKVSSHIPVIHDINLIYLFHVFMAMAHLSLSLCDWDSSKRAVGE